jgi:hypothetical protein
MMTLVQQRPNMDPVLNVDEEIHFSDALASRCFMGEGWGETEDWGVWTIGRRAELCFTIESTQAVVLRALVQPFLTPTHPRIDVRVSAAGRKVAHWTFSLDAPVTAQPQWREVQIRNRRRADRGDALDISFAIETPTSPRAEGISADGRTLGFGLRTLLIRQNPERQLRSPCLTLAANGSSSLSNADIDRQRRFPASLIPVSVLLRGPTNAR